VPSDPISRRLLKTFGNPVVAPSANVSGRLSSVTAQHVAAYFGEEISLILDGGASQEGLESTVLDLSGDEPVLLRPGTLTREKLSAAIKCEILCAKESPSLPKSPGMLLAHYAPRCPLRLSTDNPIAGEALLAFGGGEIPAGFFATENLSKTGDVVEAARNLFSALHRLEELGASRIAVMPIPEYGVGLAIMDRLRRAAV
jgi:L-threonylcarbamoyladenylate synthase